MRRADWVARLWSTIESHQATPFAYGQHDCCLFVARCVDAMCDTEHAAELSAQYSDDRTMARFLLRSGGIQAAVTARLGSPIDGWRARRGDVVLITNDDGEPALGICNGRTAVFAAPSGLAVRALDHATHCWRVD